jgi:hypothetical protein
MAGNFILDYVAPVLTGAVILGFIFWLGYFFNKFLWKTGLWRLYHYVRLKKKFAKRKFEPTKEMVEWVERGLEKEWTFKDMKTFTKYEKRKADEYMWSFLLMEQMRKEEETNAN